MTPIFDFHYVCKMTYSMYKKIAICLSYIKHLSIMSHMITYCYNKLHTVANIYTLISVYKNYRCLNYNYSRLFHILSKIACEDNIKIHKQM